MKNGKNGHHRCAPARNGRAKAAADLDADARPSPLTHAAARAPRAAPSVGAVFDALFPAAVAAPDVGFLALGADSLDLQSLADALGASPTLLLERCTYAALRDGDGAAAAEEPSPEPEARAAAAGVVEVFAALFPAAVAEPDVGFLALGADSLDLQALADALGSSPALLLERCTLAALSDAPAPPRRRAPPPASGAVAIELSSGALPGSGPRGLARAVATGCSAVSTARRRQRARRPASAIDYYAPSLCVAASALEAFHGCAGRYTVGRGQDRATACGDDEDAVSLGATALASLLARCRLGTGEIGRLEVGTESAVDRGKSIKSFLMALFGDHRDVEGADPRRKRTVEWKTSLSRSNRRADTTNACYGGTNAFLSSARWIGDGRTYAVVVCADPAVHPDPARLSEVGAAGCAVLASARAALPLEAPRATFVKHAWDFYRPVGWRTNDAIFHVAAATAQYDEALLWCARSLRLGDAPERFAFHNNAPYHAKRNLRVLRDDVAGRTLPRADHDAAFLERAAAGLGVAAENGTTYTCPLYASLLSFALGGDAGGRLRCMAYGSGCAATLFSLGDARRPLVDGAAVATLRRREPKPVEAVLAAVEAFEATHGRFGFEAGTWGRARAPLHGRVVAEPAQGRAAPRARAARPRARARGADPDAVAAALAFDVVGTAFGADEPMMAAGLDSLGASELAAALGKALSSAVSSTLVFDHPTLRGLAAFLGEPRADEEEEVGEEVEEEVEEEDAPSSPPEEDAPPSPPEDDAPPSPTDEDAPPSTHSPATMKVVAVDAEGGDIAWRSAPRPTLACRPGRRGVVVAPTCVGLSFADNLFLHGRYQVKRPLPIVPGIECAGVATAVGAGCAGGRAGDAVGFWSLSGGCCAVEVVARASECVWLGDVDGAQALAYAALGVNYTTAYFALAVRNAKPPGGYLLVLGAAGGLGAAAVELGALLGYEVIACASTPEKRAFCAARGATRTVDYSRRRWHRDVVAATGGVDLVVDPVGGDALVACLRCVAVGGAVLSLGYASGATGAVPVEQILQRNVALVGVWASRGQDAAGVAKASKAVVDLWRAGKLRPPVDVAWPLSDLRRGLARVAGRKALGKVVLVVPSADWAAASPPKTEPPVPLVAAAPRVPSRWTADHGAVALVASARSGRARARALRRGGGDARVDVPPVADHVVARAVLLPGVAFVDVFFRDGAAALADVLFLRPLAAAARDAVRRSRRREVEIACGGAVRAVARALAERPAAPRGAARRRGASPPRPSSRPPPAPAARARAPPTANSENFSSRRPGRARPVAAAATRPGRRRPARAARPPRAPRPRSRARARRWSPRGFGAALPGAAAPARGPGARGPRRRGPPGPGTRRRGAGAGAARGPPPPASPWSPASPQRWSPRSPRRRRRRGVAPADAVAAAAAAAFLGTAVDGEAPLMAAGLDSVSAAEFSRASLAATWAPRCPRRSSSTTRTSTRS
ncbi:Zinc-binding dehydrogenase [Aureococcus anophagefferens]|uniref:Zinc-binding dehydrogenase n=1 Tax=Aureococcus anophagefferens TaxID=44056 RepID=A0ABR1G6F3_AURAN